MANDTSLTSGYTGETDTAYRFRGSQSSYVRLPNNGNFNTESITLLAWFNTESSSDQQTILQFSSEGSLDILLAIQSFGSLYIYLEVFPKCSNQPISIFPSIVFRIRTWYFIVFSYDYATGLINIRMIDTNGYQQDKTFPVGDIELETHRDIWLGYGPESKGAFTGSIACVQIYSHTLSQDEVTEAQKMCLPKSWSEPFALYALNSKDLARDISGNSNPDGTSQKVDVKDGPFAGEKSVQFNGNENSYIRISHSGELSMNASFSILAWIYAESIVRNSDQIATFTCGNNTFSGLLFGGSKLVKLVGSLHFPNTGNSFEYMTLTMVTLFLYIDNNLKETKFVGSGTVCTSGEVVIGKSFPGRIACLQFYRRPLLWEHVEDAKDKCNRSSPDPPVCSLTSHVTNSPCSSSSLVTASSGGSISIDATYLAVDVVTTSVSALDNSLLWTENVTITQETISVSNTATIISSTLMPSTSNIGTATTHETISSSNTTTIISSTLIFGTSNIGIQPTTVGIPKTILSDNIVKSFIVRNQ
ncbi:hypothetical protein OS493_022546 [Desmophyllum pertusum]|uniref:Uncharacterized protein n=1 Tax=Desmophyllum pertusum TaxID=174260 RepID=A0A9W9ZBR6_9CNID|nr:hypothetical protein OS493_022546 [Desmophyllum pertusum]